MTFVSYAQNFEDVLLHRVFGGQETGFYVDIGAYHPVDGSVTKAFYDRGWSGINIEPGAVFETLLAARPRDVNLRMLVLDRAGEAAFLDDAADAGMSRVVEAGTAAARLVPCDRLEAIVRAHGGGRVPDFVKIDAEGAEAAIIGSTDWRAFRPAVLVVEATLPWTSTLANQEWEPVLLGHGYVRAYFDGINCFYVPVERHAGLRRHFEVPVNVLDGVWRHDPATAAAALQERVDAAASALAALERQHLARVDAEYLVRAAYLGVLKREPDPAALAVYGAGLRAGVTLQGLLGDLIRAPEFLQAWSLAPVPPAPIPPAVEPTGPAASTLAPLVLPGGGRMQIRCGAADLSITGALRATDGVWEPHVQAFLERTVRPDWVCLDIGANAGIHTLNMATLASLGQVHAFEADPCNATWLGENADALPVPHGAITVVGRAVWNADGPLHVASFDELAGCSFISRSADRDDSERRMRQTGPEMLAGMALHRRMTEIEAVTLDSWAAQSGLRRLDLIKLDVQGSEARVLQGAAGTLRRFRPILLTEYDRQCSTVYFGDAPDAYFGALRAMFPLIRVLGPDGVLSEPVTEWDVLRGQLEPLGWADLVCSFG